MADKDTPCDQAARQAWAYLDARPDALVIFDNVVEPTGLNVPFAPGLIPTNLRCRTLFTTRQRDFPRNFRPFEVKVLPEMAAMQLLLRERPEVLLEEHHPEWGVARIVCALLGWLPLAPELAAAYLSAYPEVTLKGYLERLRAEGKLTTVDDTELRPEDLPTRHAAAVAATLRTQWSRLDEEEDKDARLLFRAAGQFPEATWIPAARLGLLTGIEAEVGLGRPAPLTRTLKKLHEVSLIEELTGERLRLHPLVREFAAGLSPGAFRVEMAAQLAQSLGDILNLEVQVRRRGIYAVLEDLRTGLWLCADRADVQPMYAQLTELEHVLSRETHNLKDWDLTRQPAYLLQHVYNRAAILGLGALRSRAESLLASRPEPYMVQHWCAGHRMSALVRTLVDNSEVYAVAVTPDGHRVISGSHYDTLKVWDLRTGREEHTLAGHTGEVCSVAVTPDGRRVISASRDGTLRIWDIETGHEVRTLAGHKSAVDAVVVTRDGCRVISASRQHALKVWDLESGREECTLVSHKRTLSGAKATPDGRPILRMLPGGTEIEVRDPESGRAEFIRVYSDLGLG